MGHNPVGNRPLQSGEQKKSDVEKQNIPAGLIATRSWVPLRRSVPARANFRMLSGIGQD
jgi:hypothetical protein